ncbi:MAG TPA: hypothetical protein VH593_23980 [Ktedonobacteraceae bacterium]
MTATIQLKRRVGSTGTPTALAEGEPAFHDPGGGPAELFIGTTPAGVLPLVSSSRQVELTGSQTIGGVKTFSLASFKLTGGTANYVLQTDGAGNLSWVAQPDLSGYAPLASPTFTGDPKAPTPATADNDTSIATTAFVKAQGYALSTDLAGYQPLDADLTALAALSGIGVIYYRSAANTWTGITIGTGLSFTGGTLDAPVFTPSAKGEVPASGGGTTNFLRADGTWNAPPSGGGGISEAPTDGRVYARSNSLWLPAAGAHNNLINGKIVESHALNAATYAIKTLAGADPSAADPVFCIFGDGSILTLTTAISITIPSTATLTTANNQPFRIWFVLFNDGGTPRVGVTRRTNGTNATPFIWTFDARGVANATAISTSATGTLIYANATVTNQPYRVIGFADYESGLPTAGNWSASPTRIMLVNPQTPLPGAVLVSSPIFTASQVTTGGAAAVASAVTQLLTPTSPINPFQVSCDSDCYVNLSGTADTVALRIWRNDATALWIANNVFCYGGIQSSGHFSIEGIDFPFSVSAVRYRLFFSFLTGGQGTCYVPWVGGSMVMRELMV